MDKLPDIARTIMKNTACGFYCLLHTLSRVGRLSVVVLCLCHGCISLPLKCIPSSEISICYHLRANGARSIGNHTQGTWGIPTAGRPDSISIDASAGDILHFDVGSNGSDKTFHQFLYIARALNQSLDLFTTKHVVRTPDAIIAVNLTEKEGRDYFRQADKSEKAKLQYVRLGRISEAELTELLNFENLIFDIDENHLEHLPWEKLKPAGLVVRKITGKPLPPLSNLKILDLHNWEESNVDSPSILPSGYLKDFVQLRRLGIHGNIQLASPAGLQALRNLESFHWDDSRTITDLGFIKGLSNLSVLSLGDCRSISSLEPIRNNNRLRVVFLDNCTKIADLSALGSLSSLQSLRILTAPHVNNLSFLSKISGLTDLHLLSFPNVADFSPLSNSSCLKRLVLRKMAQLDNLEALQSITSMNVLKVTECKKVSDLSPLSNLTDLVELDLAGSTMIRDLSPLRHLNKLTILRLYGCSAVEDLEPIGNLSALSYLDMRNCERIADLRPLSNLQHLLRLRLAGCNRIKDFTPIMKLGALKELDLETCRSLTYSQVNQLKAALPDCQIKWTRDVF